MGVWWRMQLIGWSSPQELHTHTALIGGWYRSPRHTATPLLKWEQSIAELSLRLPRVAGEWVVADWGRKETHGDACYRLQSDILFFVLWAAWVLRRMNDSDTPPTRDIIHQILFFLLFCGGETKCPSLWLSNCTYIVQLTCEIVQWDDSIMEVIRLTKMNNGERKNKEQPMWDVFIHHL